MRTTTSTRPSPTTRSAPWPRTCARPASAACGSLCLADHVRASTALGAGLRGRRGRAAAGPRAELLAGVEAKILDRHRPARPAARAARGGPGADRRPPVPRRARAGSAAGQVRDALASAASAPRPRSSTACSPPPRRPCPLAALPQLAHLFSLLPKMGLDEADVPGPGAAPPGRGAAAGPARGWRSTRSGPARRPGRCGPCAAAGVPLVASTDSHDCATVGALPAGPAASWPRRFAGAVPR